MAAISIRITNATYADAATACSSGPADIGSGNQTLWYDDSAGSFSLSNLPQGGLQLYTEETLTQTDEWTGTSTYYYCNNEGGPGVDCAIEVIDTGKIGAVTYCSPSVQNGTETVATGGELFINIHDLISDNIDAPAALTVTLTNTTNLGELGTYDSTNGEVQYTAENTAGTEIIEFTARDQNGNVSSIGQITITITQANTAPTTTTADLTFTSG